jgi:hypothetical protein
VSSLQTDVKTALFMFTVIGLVEVNDVGVVCVFEYADNERGYLVYTVIEVTTAVPLKHRAKKKKNYNWWL